MIRLIGSIAISSVALMLAGCSGESRFVSDPANPSELSDIEITDLAPDKLPGFDVEVVQGEVAGNRLVLILRYSGGCVDHDYSCYMTPPAFLEALPVQANLFVKDNVGNDPCDAVITETAIFSLSPVTSLYFGQYFRAGSILLNVYELDTGVPIKKFTLLYSFDQGGNF